MQNKLDRFTQLLVACNRGDRPGLLYDITMNHHIPQQTLNEWIRWIWCDTEFPHEWKYEWEELWNCYNDPHNSKLCNRLFQTERILYRGGNRQGQSWTFSKDIAKFFQSRGFGPEVRRLHTRTVSRHEVLAVFNDRREQEVVLRLE